MLAPSKRYHRLLHASHVKQLGSGTRSSRRYLHKTMTILLRLQTSKLQASAQPLVMEVTTWSTMRSILTRIR